MVSTVRVSTIRAAYRRVDEWMRRHPRVNLALLVVVPGAAWAAASVAVTGDDIAVGVLSGLLFGLVYATLTYFWGDFRDRIE